MRNLKKILCLVLSVLMVGSCMGIAASADEAEDLIGTTGSFNMINFNVAGLPIPASETEDGRDAYLDTLQIGAKLNEMNYDIVAIQEDFNYDIYLRELMTNYANRQDWVGDIGERHQTNHSGGVPLGDGLNIFSTFSLYNEYRVPWDVSAGVLDGGADELTYKGILVSTIKLAEGRYVDIYDIHADAYGDTASVNARKAQYTQLTNYIKKHSVYDETTGTYDHAVIVMGDFNSSICFEDSTGDAYLISKLLEPAHLNDAWAVNQISEITEDPEDYSAYYTYAKETNLSYEQTQGHYDSVERICYADGNGVDLSCDSFGYLQITEDGTNRPLSDHCAAEAVFTYKIVEKEQDFSNSHDKENVAQDKGLLMMFLEYIASIFRAIGKLIAELGKGFAL